MATLTQVRFTLAAPDLARATAWYTSALGMAVDFTAPGWSFLPRGAFRVMLGECRMRCRPMHWVITAGTAMSPWMTRPRLDEYRAAGLEFTQLLADKPWGMREFGIRTPDGYSLMFGQDLHAGR